MAKAKRRGMRKAYLKRWSAEYVNVGATLTTAIRNDFFKHDIGAYGKRATQGLPFMLEGKPIRKVIEENLGQFNSIFFIKTENQTLQLYFSGNTAFFISTVGRAWKRSIVYPSVERAKLSMKMQAITWVENGVASGNPPSA